MTQPPNRGPVDGLAIPRFGGPATYVSLDIDVLDPVFAPGTGTPEVGGLTSRQLLNMLRSFGELNLVGATWARWHPPTTTPR